MNFDDAKQRFERQGHPVRTRFAPSPTGHLHLGHVASACFVWASARLLRGTVALRIEDHDRGRCRPEYEASIREDLDWLGFEADTAPGRGSWRQSERNYQKVLDQLGTKVYPCSCSRRDIRLYYQKLVIHPNSDSRHDFEGDSLRYPGLCRSGPQKHEGPFGYRLMLTDQDVRFDDLWLGAQFYPSSSGDVLVRERSGDFTYLFCVVQDDIDQNINLIVRGQDLLGATATQERMRHCFGASGAMLYFHHPLILGADGRKLSKSLGSQSIRQLREDGVSAASVLRLALAATFEGDPEFEKVRSFNDLVDALGRRQRSVASS